MSLKVLVNDPKLWNALLEELDKRIKSYDDVLKASVEPHILYRQQGSIMALEGLKRLRKEVNGTK